MRITKNGEHAPRTMARHGVAQCLDEGFVSTSAIGASDRFLEAVLFKLKQGGFVECFRGKDGGVQLSKASSAIKIGGKAAMLDCLIKASNQDATVTEEGILVGVSTRANLRAVLQGVARPENKSKLIVTDGCRIRECCLSAVTAAQTMPASYRELYSHASNL